ncbi:sensor histidine kinase [Paractinoplanes globisporus]|uniref:histidine kinase n=1 Tax=Paractinoplanes globisporus TaxID=113565 RepID=A0ABW6WAR1_9ACTN|nr:histidine kinase [Actinoplanes globisporus]
MFAARWRPGVWAGPVMAVLLAVPLILDPPAGRPFWAQAVILAGLVLPLIGRRRRPEAMTVIVLAAAWLGLFTRTWAEHLPLAHLSLHVMLYTLVVRGRRASALVALPAVAGFFAAWTLTAGAGPDASWSLLTYGLSIATVWLLAEWVRARRAYIRSIERRAELADAERRALSRAAVAEERTRIARELHDVLAHSVSVMVVNAEGALLMRHTDPAVVDRTLQLVSSTGREALTELRRLLAVLVAGAELTAPQPVLADLHRLAAGVDGATLRVTGSDTGVPAGAVVQTYRIVQEALTNVVRHAGRGVAAEVTVDLGEPGPHRAIRIEVRNDGSATPFSAPRLPSSGRGISGMRERVAMFDGTLSAAPRPEGGYRVVATLPLGAPITALPQVAGDSMG